jgi:hypothetical protein
VPSVALVSLFERGSRNRKDHERTPLAVARNARPEQRSSLISTLPDAGAATVRMSVSVSGFFIGWLRVELYWGHTGGTI